MAALVALVLAAGGASPAAAADEPFYYFCTVAEYSYKHCAGKGTFDSDGDILHVGDTRADDASVWVEIDPLPLGGSDDKLFEVDEGAGTIKTYNLNYKEGADLDINISLEAPGHSNAVGYKSIDAKA